MARWQIMRRASNAPGSLRFFGNNAGAGTTAIDRVVISLDAPATDADVGAGDFTLEGWLRTDSGNNASLQSTGANYDFVNTNIFWDRDRLTDDPAWGVGLGAGRITFSVKNASATSYTLVGATDIRDSAWHHVAVTREQSTGNLAIYLDGSRDANTTSAPSGDLSYPNGAVGATWDPYLVFGAEKHDFDPAIYPSFYGYMACVRISNNLRYTGTSYTVPTAPLTDDANTLCLYLMNEGSGTTMTDSAGNANGTLRQGGTNNGPQWSSLSPF